MGISAKPLPHSYPNRQQGHWDIYIPDPISYCLRAVFFGVCMLLLLLSCFSRVQLCATP